MRIVIEKLFSRLAKIIVTHAVFVIIGMMTLMVVLSLPLANMDVDSSIEYYLKDDDSHLIAYKQFKKLFGSDERIVIGIQSPDIFSVSFFERLRALHQSLESNVPYIQKINCLITAPIFEGSHGHIAVNTLLDSWPETPKAFRSALNLIRSAPLYRNRFYTSDESFAIVTLSIDSHTADAGTQLTEDILSVFETDITESPTSKKVENEAISLSRKEVKLLVNAVYNVVNRHQHKDFQIYPTGLPMYRQFIGKMIRHDTIFLSDFLQSPSH